MIVMRYILGFLFLGGCWHAGALALGPDLLPDPVATIRLFAESLGTPEFWGHILVSLWRLTLGLVAAVAVAFPLGLLLGHCRAADLAGSPLLFITYPLPKIVLLPVFFTLVGLGDASRVLLIALTTGYQVLVIIRAGALSIDPSWAKAFRSMGGTTAEAVRHLYVPAALPALFTSLKVASGTAVAVLFLAESFATTSGLGYLIMDAWGMGDVLSMFNAILGMSLLGLVIYGVIGLLERVCCPWLFAGRRWGSDRGCLFGQTIINGGIFRRFLIKSMLSDGKTPDFEGRDCHYAASTFGRRCGKMIKSLSFALSSGKTYFFETFEKSISAPGLANDITWRRHADFAVSFSTGRIQGKRCVGGRPTGAMLHASGEGRPPGLRV